MELGELGEPRYEQGLLVLFREERGLLSFCSVLSRKVAPGQEGVQEAGICLGGKFNSL